MEMYIPFLVVAWILAGLVYADYGLKVASAADDAGSRGLVAGIRQLEMASLGALLIFVAIWPAPLAVLLYRWYGTRTRTERDAKAERYVHERFGKR